MYLAIYLCYFIRVYYTNTVSFFILQEHDLLKCISHTDKFEEWQVENLDVQNLKFMGLVWGSSLYSVHASY